MKPSVLQLRGAGKWIFTATGQPMQMVGCLPLILAWCLLFGSMGAKGARQLAVKHHGGTMLRYRTSSKTSGLQHCPPGAAIADQRLVCVLTASMHVHGANGWAQRAPAP